MGGNLIIASPIGDSAPVLFALEAKVVLVGQASRLPPSDPDGLESSLTPVLRERNVPIGEFFVAYRQTALQPGEVLKTIIILRGDAEKSLSAAPWSLTVEYEFGGQEHFYLETQAARAEQGEDDSMFVCSSKQHPSEVQEIVAHVLHQPINKIVVQSLRHGGGDGSRGGRFHWHASRVARGYFARRRRLDQRGHQPRAD